MNFGLYKGYDPSKKNTYRFLGLNKNRFTSNGEFEDMTNMSSREYPCAAPRGYRKSYAEIPGTVQAVAAPDSSRSGSAISGFTGIAGGAFYYDGVIKSGKYVLSEALTWSIIRKNHLYIISGYNYDTKKFDQLFYNIDTDKFNRGDGVMDNLIVTTGRINGKNAIRLLHFGYSDITSYKPELADGTVIDCSRYFNQYMPTSSFSDHNPFTDYFAEGDYISISGFPTADESVGQVFRIESGEVVPQHGIEYESNNTADIYERESASIETHEIYYAKVTGFYSNAISGSGINSYYHYMYVELLNKNRDSLTFDEMKYNSYVNYCCGVTVAKRAPKFDSICIFNHSLFGSLPNGNALYGSYIDDITDFQSTDENGIRLYSYLESDYPGKFTGLCVYNNELAAFKESSISVIYGSNYASYSQYIISGIGCIDKESIAVTPQGIIFLSYNGFYIFTGSATPTFISSCMKDMNFKSARGGYDEANRIYYAAAVDSEGRRRLYTYSLDYSIWHIEDDINATGMFMYRGGFYIADMEKVYLVNMFPAAASDTWSFTSVRTHNSTLDNKTITAIWIRADCDSGGRFKLEISVDDGAWTEHGEYGIEGLYVYYIPVRIIVGSTFRYRISGNGNVIIHEVEINMPIGGRSYKAYPNEPAEKLPDKSEINLKY